MALSASLSPEMRARAVPAACALRQWQEHVAVRSRANLHTHVALGCTPSTPHDQPAPLAALSKRSCEYESVNVV